MSLFLVLLFVAALLAVLVTLIRGLVNMAQATDDDWKGPGPSPRALKSNKLMQNRVLFQAGAILIIVLLLLVAGSHGS
jgi:hypothetical protein